MKFNHSILVLTVLSLSIFSCQKETSTPLPEEPTPLSEEFVIYESGEIVTDRAANTANVSWSSTAYVDARFEVLHATTSAVLYSYGWIFSNSGSNTANYTVPSGTTVRLRIKARKAVGAPASTLTYAFNSTCPITGCGCGTLSVTLPAGSSWVTNLGATVPTGGCL